MKMLTVIIGLLLVVALLVPVSCAKAPAEAEEESMSDSSYVTGKMTERENRYHHQSSYRSFRQDRMQASNGPLSA